MSRIGVLGAGQLGRMLALAGYPLGARFRFLDPAADSPAGHLAEHRIADYTDIDALERFVQGLDVVTYEFENVPVETAYWLEQHVPVYPPPLALQKSQDRLVEKNFFRSLGIPTPAFAAVGSRADLEAALQLTGLPAVLKTRRLGYDGKGQWVLRSPEDLEPAWQASALQAIGETELILEQYIPFDRELSILAVRGKQACMAFYPLVENHHRQGILRLSLSMPVGAMAYSPSAVPSAGRPRPTGHLQVQAEAYVRAVLEALDYVGVLAIELFEHNGQLLANEMAPRVHNSGHWTIEGAVTSQFENHLRAICGLPLGNTQWSEADGCACAMLNWIGTMPPAHLLLQIPGVHWHDYAKSPRPGRKLGHLTLVEPDAARLKMKLHTLGSLLIGLAEDEPDGEWRSFAKELLLDD